MNLPAFSIDRPVFTSMIVILVLVLGGVAFQRLPVDLLPAIERSTLSVNTSYENASPQEVEETVTRPLEQGLAAVSGLREMRSNSREGSSTISLDFTWGTNLDEASNNVRDRIDRVLGQLPDDVSRPQVRQFDSSAMPVMFLGFAAEMDPISAREFVEESLLYRFERLPGVASVTVAGGLARQIRVDLDFDRVKALGLSFTDLIDRIGRGNVNTPGGNIEEGHREVRVRVPGTYASVDELADTIIQQAAGGPVRLRDVARVTDGAADRRSINRIDGVDAVQLRVFRQSGSNTVAVSDAILAEVERLNAELPQGRFVVLMDQARFVRQSIRNVSSSAFFGGMLAIVVLLVFLRSFRNTVSVALAIPVSVVACFTLIFFSGFTLNIMTLGGLALGIGMLLDSSIVVLENIIQKRDRGADRRTAALRGATEVNTAILASTITTVVVFLPLLFIAGMAGLLFRELAFVVAFSLLCSYLVALSIVPMLAARVIGRTAGDDDRSLPARALKRLFAALEDRYAGLLAAALAHRGATLLLTAIALATALAVAPRIGSELMPPTDESAVTVSFEMEPGTKLAVVERKVVELEERIRREVGRDLAVLRASAGGTGWRVQSVHEGEIDLQLVPVAERRRSSAQVALHLNRALADVAGARIRCRVRSSILGRIVGGQGDNTIDIDVRGYDLDTGKRLATEIGRRAETLDGVTDARVSRDVGVPERNIRVDRRKASDLGLSVKDVADALRTMIAGRTAGRFKSRGKEHDIVVRVDGADKMALEEILDLTIPNRRGEQIVLRNLLEDDAGEGPSGIERKDRERIVTVSVSAPGRDMGTVVEELRGALADLPIPEGFALVYSGSYEEQQRSFRELRESFLLALLLVYIVMACQFESLRDPFIVMFSVPLAAIGVIAALILTGTTLNLQSFIGCIMLAGIVVNNAILLVDQTNLIRDAEGLTPRDALVEAGRRRLRPILMTALTTMLGLLPLALGLGDGAEAQAPMARAVIGGLISSSLITLVVVPVVYSFVSAKRAAPAPAPEA